MSRRFLADGLVLTGGDRGMVAVVAVIALAALVVGYILLKEVLAAGQGTTKMQEIAKAVQEGAAAYLNRQFRTLGVFAVIVFVLLFALPADSIGERIGRSIFFLIGALFSAAIGYLGMWLATRANVRVAAAANTEGREQAMQIAFPHRWCRRHDDRRSRPARRLDRGPLVTPARPPRCWRASASVPRCSPCS